MWKKKSPLILAKDPLQSCLTHFDINEFDCDSYTREVNTLLHSPKSSILLPWTIKYEPLSDLAKEPLLSSVQSPPQLELKSLTNTLKYVYLGPNNTLPTIIATSLNSDEENQLVDLLKQHKSAIGWSVADLKKISLAVCMHCIYYEENTKPFREAQRRLNSNMREVVNKEEVKWLDVDIIYPIFDSQ